MMISVIPLTSNPVPSLLHKSFFVSGPFRPSSKSHICFAFSPSGQDPMSEEARWLREEQRWLREEQRWNAERQALLQEISSLKLRIQELERLNSVQGASVTDTVANIAKLLQVLKDGDLGKNVNRIPESGLSAVPLVVEAAKTDEEVVVKEVISIPDEKSSVKIRATLRKGSEGDDVRAMQEALQILGFYSGEEDTEYSSFSSGTERAVKTWQAALGVPEDGIMTAELLERLFGSSAVMSPADHIETDEEKNGNGAPVGLATDISEIEKTIVTERGVTEVSVSEHRVFLLGENRWEEPSRLSGRNKGPITKSSTGNTTIKCVSCRGEGRLLCMECDGTGEPNIEPQFIEWVDEGAKCPYCEGLGFTTCDACGGTTATKTQ